MTGPIFWILIGMFAGAGCVADLWLASYIDGDTVALHVAVQLFIVAALVGLAVADWNGLVQNRQPRRVPPGYDPYTGRLAMRVEPGSGDPLPVRRVPAVTMEAGDIYDDPYHIDFRAEKKDARREAARITAARAYFLALEADPQYTPSYADDDGWKDDDPQEWGDLR